MNPHQQAFVNALKHWDGDAMAAALIAIAERLAEVVCTDAARADVSWTCREFLDELEVSRRADFVFGVEACVAFVLVGAIDEPTLPGRAGNPQLRVRLGLSALESAGIRARWKALGFSADDVVIAADQVRTPFPLGGTGGEPDGPLRYRPRSIHRPPVHPMSERHTYAYALGVAREEPKPLLSRYLAGECEAVWDVLSALGDRVRTEGHLGDAVSVARETMRRCRENVQRLAGRLRSMGYLFECSDKVVVPPEPDVLDRIADLEREVGPVPLSVCAWHEIVGSVCFRGHLPAWRALNAEAYPDPLEVQPSASALEYDEENWYRHRYHLELSGDDCTKEGFSGGTPYMILLPDPAADARVEYEPHATEFVNYLRICFRWGGFPGWEREPEDRRPNDVLRALATDLLPI